ncbi:MAG: type II secretion system F family protein [Pseudomonadota bacterium]
MIDLIRDPQFIISVLTSVAVFATIMTIAMPFLDSSKLNSRMKYVAMERDALRAKRLAELKVESSKGKLRGDTPQDFMKQVVDKLNLRQMFETTEMRNRLRMAGFRGQGPVVIFLFFRILLLLAFLLASAFYFFLINDHGYTDAIKLLIVLGFGYFGFFLPNLLLSNLIQKRQKVIKKAFPDALDLLLICVQSGMSAEAAFNNVSKEIGRQCVELAEELSLTTAELSYLQTRQAAYENLGLRTGLPGVKAVCTSLTQAERYGTPLSQALRVMAQENRDMRMAEAEKKAAALPPKLTVPMIVFFLPVLFVVILGPAAIKVMEL